MEDITKLKGRRSLAHEIASRSTDPNFYATLEFLPNPDRILRKLGKTQEIYEDITGDAHVIGELRSIRSALLGFEWRVMPGADDPASQRAYEIVQKRLETRPGSGLQWSDIIWTMGCAVFRGFAVHEVVWQRADGLLMPSLILDRPQRRFLFGQDNGLRLKTREHPAEGVELGSFKWLITRHMSSFDNPYGVAVFSSCFWPYIFKHSGFKYFAKFTERYGFPWPIGKYPPGTPKDQQDEFADNLARMVEDAVAVIPADSTVDLLTVNQTGQLAHERIIKLCNSELSKALTSQTLATEIQGQGSRAASQTHRERETSVNESDRAIIEHTFNELFEWITTINVAGATPPRFEFFEEAEARKEMVDSLKVARELVPLSKREVYTRLQLTPPEDEDDTIPVAAPTPNPPPVPAAFTACPHCGGHHFAQAGDDPVADIIHQATELGDVQIEALTGTVAGLLDESADLDDFRRRLIRAYPNLDTRAQARFVEQALQIGFLQGMDDADDA